jgi:protein-L-isoaspartate O-methyltransferase
MAKKKVLLIGVDPKLIDSSLATTTGWDTNRIQAAAQDINKRLMELGYEVQSCLIDPKDTSQGIVLDTLSKEKFDCIIVGAGVRTLPQHTVLFEKKSILSIRRYHQLQQKYVSILIQATLLKQYSVGYNQQHME